LAADEPECADEQQKRVHGHKAFEAPDPSSVELPDFPIV